MTPRSSLLRALFTGSLLFLLCACMPRIPLLASKVDIDTAAIESGQKSLVILRVQTEEGIPVESRWTNVTTGEEIKISTHFLALTRSGAQEYDMVSIPPGTYTLTYLLYSRGSQVSLPWSAFTFDASAPISPLGQVFVRDNSDNPTTSTNFVLRTRGLQPDRESPVFASFTVEGGKVIYFGDMTIKFSPSNRNIRRGVHPAQSAAFKIQDDSQRAKTALQDEKASLLPRFTTIEIHRGALAEQY